MEIECPICEGKILPFKICEGQLMFLCTSRKCSFPLGYDHHPKYTASENSFPQCIFRVQSSVIQFKIQGCALTKAQKTSSEQSDSTDLDS